jgi:hypothetical protein
VYTASILDPLEKLPEKRDQDTSRRKFDRR